MIADLKPYAVVRDSGIVWLGEIPKSWDVLRGRQLFEIKKRISGELGHPVISVTQEGLRIKDVESGEGQLSEDYSKYQTVGVGEFAMNSMDLLTGGVGIATSLGVTSPDYRVFAIRDESRCCDMYMLHVLRMLYRNRGFYAWGQGSAQLGRWRLPRKRFNDFPFPVPPITEQVSIARFLDWANGRTERAIRAKRKVIALLNEQKQAIIHRAVTRGVDPSVPLKHSGIPWLGDIPEHWEVRRLKILGTKFGSGVTPRGGASVYQDSGVPLLRSQNVHFGELRLDRVARISPQIHAAMAGTQVQPGDVLLNITGASIGRVCAVPAGVEQANVNQHVCIIRPIRARCDSEYLAMFLATEAAQTAIYIAQNGSSREGLAVSEVKALPIVLPPLEEQRAIGKGIQQETQGVRNAISHLEREIELLREYRNRLVADVVTGKLDVREAARQLPEKAAEPELVADTERDPEEAEV